MRRATILTGLLVALLTAPAHADALPEVAAVRVDKSARTLTLLDEVGRAIRTYRGIQLGDSPTGPKHFAGDERTPEGRYAIDWGNPNSAYYLSLHISYPSAADRAYAAAAGRAPGGAIFIHGQPNSLQSGRIPGDWTDGCIALSNEQVAEIWSLVPDGTPIDLYP